MTAADASDPTFHADHDERDAIVRKHVGLVHYVARRLAEVLDDRAELDELLSAGLMGLLQAVERFDASRGLAFSTYATPRIRGAMLDELRRFDRIQQRASTLDAELPSFNPDIEIEIDRELERERIRRAIEELPPPERRVLEMSFYDGLTLQQIAPHLGVTESGASRIRSRALRQLKERLATLGIHTTVAA